LRLCRPEANPSRGTADGAPTRSSRNVPTAAPVTKPSSSSTVQRDRRGKDPPFSPPTPRRVCRGCPVGIAQAAGANWPRQVVSSKRWRLRRMRCCRRLSKQTNQPRGRPHTTAMRPGPGVAMGAVHRWHPDTDRVRKMTRPGSPRSSGSSSQSSSRHLPRPVMSWSVRQYLDRHWPGLCPHPSRPQPEVTTRIAGPGRLGVETGQLRCRARGKTRRTPFLFFFPLAAATPYGPEKPRKLAAQLAFCGETPARCLLPLGRPPRWRAPPTSDAAGGGAGGIKKRRPR